MTIYSLDVLLSLFGANGLVVAKWGVGGEEKDRKFGIINCKLVYIAWINKVLPYSIGNYIQCPVINHNGKNIYMFN